MPTRSEAPPAGQEHATPRPDLRGYRLGLSALITRPQEQVERKRLHGLVGGFLSGLVVGVVLLGVGAPDVVSILAATLTNFAVALSLPAILIDPADRRLLRVVLRSAEAAYRDWRLAYGTATPPPRTEEQQLLWIAAQPDTTTDPRAIAIEGSILLLLGRYEAARERAERLPDDVPVWRLDRALGLATIEFESGAGPGDLAEAQAALEALRGPRRPHAIASVALEEANRAMIRGEDWGPPIARAAGLVGSPRLVAALMALGRVRSIAVWLVLSEVALGTILYLVNAGFIA